MSEPALRLAGTKSVEPELILTQLLLEIVYLKKSKLVVGVVE